MYALILLSLLAAPAPDTLVVCPTEFRPALVAWEQYRREQGHTILVIDPPGSAASLSAAIREVAGRGRLQYVVLVGDVPELAGDARPASHLNELWEASPTPITHRTSEPREIDSEIAVRDRSHTRGVPINYAPAKINTRWGSEPTIATDTPFGDVDGDDIPDVAVGRIPADSPEELAAVVRKVIRYERDAEHGAWQRRLNVVSGTGGFGAVTDAIIEAAGRQVFQQIVPPSFELRQTLVKRGNQQPSRGPAGRTVSTSAGSSGITDDVQTTIHRQFGEGSLVWIYLGHGMPTELDHVTSPRGDAPILSVEDVPQIECGARSPLAVLVACYTGACDASRDSLAEELALAENGPVAVIAATRVTMPYGNTVFGYELLRACFRDRPAAVGDMLRLAQCRTLGESPDDSLRTSLDAMAAGISPPPVNLPAERREHVWMYHLFGDPLLRLRLPPENVADASGTESVVK